MVIGQEHKEGVSYRVGLEVCHHCTNGFKLSGNFHFDISHKIQNQFKRGGENSDCGDMSSGFSNNIFWEGDWTLSQEGDYGWAYYPLQTYPCSSLKEFSETQMGLPCGPYLSQASYRVSLAKKPQ